MCLIAVQELPLAMYTNIVLLTFFISIFINVSRFTFRTLHQNSIVTDYLSCDRSF